MEIKELRFILANSPAFAKLKEEELAEFLALAEVKKYETGETIYHQNDPADYFYFLAKGRVVVLTSDGEREIEIDLLKRGTCFGIISLFTEEPHSVSTKAMETSYVLKIPKDKFKSFLDKHPLISLDFSRMLSQRVRAKLYPKRIFQFKRVGILGFPSVGKTTYLYHLGRILKELTQKKVICIELSLTDNFSLPYLGEQKKDVYSLRDFSEENLASFILKGECDYLLVELDKLTSFSSLLNALSESYHFILYEIPWGIEKGLNELIFCADYLHILVFSQIEELKKMGILLEELKNKNLLYPEKVRVILNEFGSQDKLSHLDKTNLLNYPIYATLVSYKEEAYQKTLVRISRQLGEMVVGLALGSGAAYGFSHIGVLEVLEREDISVDIICGSSMGALVAALWALGYSSEKILCLAREFAQRIGRISLGGFSFPWQGLIKAKHLEHISKRIFGEKTFYDVKRNLKIVAFDFTKKEVVVLDKGFLYKAVAASCAIPGIFEPVRFKEELLLDGGILNPLPIRVLLNAGANKIIAVNITPTREEILRSYRQKKRWHIFDFIFGSVERMQQEFIQQSLGLADVVIHPDFENLGWTEFSKIEEFVLRGREAVEEKLEELKNLLLP